MASLSEKERLLEGVEEEGNTSPSLLQDDWWEDDGDDDKDLPEVDDNDVGDNDDAKDGGKTNAWIKRHIRNSQVKMLQPPYAKKADHSGPKKDDLPNEQDSSSYLWTLLQVAMQCKNADSENNQLVVTDNFYTRHTLRFSLQGS